MKIIFKKEKQKKEKTKGAGYLRRKVKSKQRELF